MQQQTIVSPFSSEWVYVTFRLQLLLGTPQIQLLSLRKHSPTFSQQFQSHLKIQTAVDLTDMDLPSATSIKDSLKKDLTLRAGRVPLNLTNAHTRKYRILLLKIAISQALPCLKESNLSIEDYLTHQSQFDAVYLSPRHQQLSVFSHQYMVKDPRQYQWQYDAQFVFTERKEWQADKVVCANCKITPAKYYCPQDKEAYCWPCYGDLHRSERKSRHIKEALTPYNCPPRCQKGFHHNESLTHYCFNCKQLKCTHCLADSQHKNTQQGAHQTMECRQFAIQFKQILTQKLNEAKTKITSVIKQIQGKIQLISGHYDIRVKEFARAFEERVASIREWSTTELNKAVGLHSEIKRKYDESLWLETLSAQLEEKSDVETNMQVKEGINSYLNQCFSRDYFLKVDKRVQDLKIFS